MSEAGDPALMGRRVAGKFVVEHFVGGGAMGEVYRARDELLDRKVALKVMHPSMAVDPSFVARFHREARAASRLDHPSSMRVIEYGEEPDGLLFIAMEFLEGRDLYRVIHEDWPLSDERIGDIMMKALSAIGVAHEMGVIHRDLKPENIMILDRKDDEDRDLVKVCDFGIAKITEQDDEDPSAPPKTVASAKLTTQGLVVGTPEYMSPEQARGEKIDFRSDLYAMGIILYQLLTGRPPFLADTALAVVLKHISEEPAPPHTIYEGVHKGLEAVCLRAIAKNKNDRFPSARHMRSAIKAVLEGRPIPLASIPPTRSEPAAVHTGTKLLPAPAAVTQIESPAVEVKLLGIPPRETPSRVPAVLFFLVLLAAAGVAAWLYVDHLHTSSTPSPSPSPSPAASSSSSPAAATATTPTVILPIGSASPSPDPRPRPRSRLTSSPPDPAPHAAEPLSPVPVPVPVPVPDSSDVSSAPLAPPAPPAPPPPPPPFRATSCRASLGAPRSTSTYSVKDLTVRNADAAWSTCARSSIHDKPSGPIAATVHVRFNDNKTFKAASVSGCPPLLGACVSAATHNVVSVHFKSGDATGDPEFDIPVTFTCE